jgi:DNA-binding transcriptional LysR family regulator
MNVTFRQLRLLVALDEHQSITAAAQACHVTQPTVSMQLQALSESVGLPLYEQVGKRLFLTEAGHALVRTASTAMRWWRVCARTWTTSTSCPSLRPTWLWSAMLFWPTLWW